MNIEDGHSDNAHLLVREPIKLTEQEIEHCEALAEVLYAIFARKQEKTQEPAMNLDAVTSPRVFVPPSTAFN